MDYFKMIEQMDTQYQALKTDPDRAKSFGMPGNAYFLEDGSILSLSRDDGDSRYPYGKNGFNFWAYSSGYMHSNDGLFTQFIRVLEGMEPRIGFFAGIHDARGHSDVLSLLSVPVINNKLNSRAVRYTVFSKACVYYITEVDALRFSVRVFPDESNHIHFTVGVENLGYNSQRLFISMFLNPFLVHSFSENVENRWFREARYITNTQEDILGSFIFKVNEDLNRTTSVSNYGVVKRNITLGTDCLLLHHEATTSRYQYVGGVKGSLHTAESLHKATFGEAKHVCAFTDIGIAGDMLHLVVGAADTARYDAELRYTVNCGDAKGLETILQGSVDAERTDAVLQRLHDQEALSSDGLQFRVREIEAGQVKPDVFNGFFEHLKKQVEFCSLIKGYVQAWSNSLIGIRDIFQALEGLVFYKPREARSKIKEALGFIFIDGRCPRQYSLPRNEDASPAMDLRPFIDQGVWVISTIVAYLKATGDMAFLEESCGYYEIVDEKKGLVKKSSEQDTVLDHMMRMTDYLLANRDFEKTGCIRALYGDWNDALDGLGVSTEPGKEYGTGVSVMVSLQVYQNLKEMIELLDKYNPHKYENQKRQYCEALSLLEESLKNYAIISDDSNNKRILHGWGDKRSYLVGSFDDPDHQFRHGLTSNAFWVLSGMHDTDSSMRDTILGAFEALDTECGFKTFSPSFLPNTPGVGRIIKLPAGTAENGCAYIHASAFAIMALYRMGCPEQAWHQLVKILPFTHKKVSHSPFVMPNSYCQNGELLIDGESMSDWQTGSANVVLKTMVRYMFGLQPEYDGIWIQPAAWLPFDQFIFRIRLKGCNLLVNFKRSGNDKRRFIINGNLVKGVWSNIMGIERVWIPNETLQGDEINITVED